MRIIHGAYTGSEHLRRGRAGIAATGSVLYEGRPRRGAAWYGPRTSGRSQPECDACRGRVRTPDQHIRTTYVSHGIIGARFPAANPALSVRDGCSSGA